MGNGSTSLWVAACGAETAPAWERLGSVLSDPERRRYEAFRRPERRWQFLAGRLLLRRMLSAAFDRPIEAWRFEERPGLPPRLLTDTPGPIAFSLSHSRELVACLLAPGECVGVDVEYAGKQRDFLAIAAALYPAEWIRCLERLPPEEQRIEFYRYWTLYEAAVKAGSLEGPVWAFPAGKVTEAPGSVLASAVYGQYSIAIAIPTGGDPPDSLIRACADGTVECLRECVWRRHDAWEAEPPVPGAGRSGSTAHAVTTC
jgi:4'-phosphopantetheinyl transferase